MDCCSIFLHHFIFIYFFGGWVGVSMSIRHGGGMHDAKIITFYLIIIIFFHITEYTLNDILCGCPSQTTNYKSPNQ